MKLGSRGNDPVSNDPSSSSLLILDRYGFIVFVVVSKNKMYKYLALHKYVLRHRKGVKGIKY